MRTPNLRVVVLALVLLAAASARAQSAFARDGVYLGLGGTLGIYAEHADDLDEPVGLNARVGYRMHPHLAAEGEFEWLPEADVDGTNATVQAWTTTANVKAFVLTDRIQPFLLIGMGFMVGEGSAGGSSSTEGEFAARFGTGVDLYVTHNFLATFDIHYVLPTDNLDELDYVRIGWGIGYRF